MNRCATCRHWRELAARCGRIERDVRRAADDPAWTETDEGGTFSQLRTRAEFGCVLWEKAEALSPPSAE